MDRHTVLYNDDRLMVVAQYHESKGLTIKAEPEKVLERFAEFKNLILHGEFTLLELENDVFSKFGIVEKHPDMPDPNAASAGMSLADLFGPPPGKGKGTGADSKPPIGFGPTS